jgi:C-terminal processing protease CtpA/Prc
MRRRAFLPLVALLLAYAGGLTPCASARAQDVDYVADVRFALGELEKECGHFFGSKGIDWKKISRQFLGEARAIESDEEHHALLWRLLARLRDGHAAVRPLAAGEGIGLPEDWRTERTGPGMFWCRIGKKVYVKNSWSGAAEVGIEPGMEVLKVDGEPASKWLEQRVVEVSDRISFSTDHQALYYTCHWGLARPVGTRLKLELKDTRRNKRKRTLTYTKAGSVPWGPVFFPEDLEGDGDVRFGRTEAGWGYVHLRRCKGDLPERMDAVLEKLGDAPGMILDFRANGGGGFDHDGLLGRFVPKGSSLDFAKHIESAGPRPYTGPVLVVVDAGTRSAGETGSGMFKEEGRAYMIGEQPTAGMSASKKTIDLPSGLFALYVAVHSNKQRFNRGRGLEGIGAIPHELVEYDPADLSAGRDTLILRAEELLEDFPKKKVPYDHTKRGR